MSIIILNIEAMNLRFNWSLLQPLETSPMFVGKIYRELIAKPASIQPVSLHRELSSADVLNLIYTRYQALVTTWVIQHTGFEDRAEWSSAPVSR